MFNSPSLSYTLQTVKKIHSNQDSSHDFFHIQRVLDMAAHLNSIYNGDLELVSYLALLHDIDDKKIKTELTIRDVLSKVEIPEQKINTIENLCSLITFSNHKNLENECIEVKIVSDADKLDAIGAIGIARAFTYGSIKERPFYLSKDYDEFGQNNATIDHFQQKLLRLDKYLYTEKAKEIAKSRIEFLQQFVKNFYSEINFTESS